MPRTESGWWRSVAARLVVQGCRHEAAAGTLTQNSRLVSESWAFSTPEGFIGKPFRCNRARGIFDFFFSFPCCWVEGSAFSWPEYQSNLNVILRA